MSSSYHVMSFDQNDLDQLEAFKAKVVAEVVAALDHRLYRIEQGMIVVGNNMRHWFEALEPRLHIGPNMKGLE